MGFNSGFKGLIFIIWIANWKTKDSELSGSRRWRRQDKNWENYTAITLPCRKLGAGNL